MSEIVRDMVETYHQRVDFLRAEVRLTLQIKALCRRAGGEAGGEDALYAAAVDGKGEHPLAGPMALHLGPLVAARSGIEAARKAEERKLVKLAKALPVYPWVESQRGLGALGLAQIVGEAGDLSGYANPAKLWKRMGLAVIDGGRQRKVEGAAALLHGYNPQRRSVMWNIGDSAIRATGGQFRAVYLERKEVELKRAAEEGLIVLPAAKIPFGEKARYRSEGHVHARAKRYMEKRILRDLWREWRR